MGETPEVFASLVVAGDKKLIPALRAFVREVFRSEGMDEEGARQMELITEEACLNVVEYALAGRSDATYRVSMEKEPSRFVLAVEDEGAPMDWDKVEKGERSGLGMAILRHFAHGIQFVNRGRKGQRLEISREFFKPSVENVSIEEGDDKGAKEAMAPLDTPLGIRLMGPADGPGLARLMYRVYGYTYQEFVYFPEQVAEMLAEGLLISMVAVTPEGEIAAHQGLRRDAPDSPVAEIAMGVVDPRFRGRGLFEQMKTRSFSYVKEKGLRGLFGEAVTTHPYSQKANSALGGRETGFMLGYIPCETEFKRITGALTERSTVLLFYTRLNREPERTVFLPEHHLPMIRKIHEHGSFCRRVSPGGPSPAATAPEHSYVKVKALPDAGIVLITVLQYGEDFDALARGHLREFCTARFDCIYIDLPLSEPRTPSKCADLEKLGFFFSGIMPETAAGDMLRLQYLNNITLDPGKVVVVSDFGRELFDYVIRSWRHAEDVKFHLAGA
ncbi:MAG: ATP-binding protein [Elusimicrobia bacterium]|nr:ATP-binding protein [Elusimicrobiota bacterium]